MDRSRSPRSLSLPVTFNHRWRSVTRIAKRRCAARSRIGAPTGGLSAHDKQPGDCLWCRCHQAAAPCARRSWLFPAGLVFSIQRLLQLFLGLVVEFVVFARGLASLLPELISPPDNIHFLGCGHASSLKRSPALGFGRRGRNGAVASAVLVHHTRGIGPLRLALAGATRSDSAGVGSLGRDPMMRLCRNEPESIGINT